MDYVWLWFSPPEPQKNSEKIIFQRLMLSLSHSGQKVPESPVSQLQYGETTPSLTHLIDLTKKDY